MDDDEDGNPIFLHSSFDIIADDFTAYFGQSHLRKYDLSAKDIKESLQLLPDEDVYPKAPRDITTYTLPIYSTVFPKGPMLNTAFIGTGLLPKLILQEAHTPNPRAYSTSQHCPLSPLLIRRGRIVGIVLDRHSMTLDQRLKDRTRRLDVETPGWIDEDFTHSA